MAVANPNVDTNGDGHANCHDDANVDPNSPHPHLAYPHVDVALAVGR